MPGPSTARLGHGVGHVIPLRLKQPRRVSSGSAVSSLDGTVRVCLLHQHREGRARLDCTMECCKYRHGFFIGPYASYNVSTRMTGEPSMDAGLRVASSSARSYLSWRRHDWAPTRPGTSVLGIPRVAQDAILIPWRFFVSCGSQLDRWPEWCLRVPEGALQCPGCRLPLPCLAHAAKPSPRLLFLFLFPSVWLVTDHSFSDGQRFM